LEDVREEVATLDLFEIEAEEVAQELGTLDDATISEEGIHQFRDWLIETARESGCQVREIGLGAARLRGWKKEDNPLEASTDTESGEGVETGYALRSQEVSYTVSGPMPHVKKLLLTLHTANKLMHVGSVDLRPEDSQEGGIRLMLELSVFDLPKSKETMGGGYGQDGGEPPDLPEDAT